MAEKLNEGLGKYREIIEEYAGAQELEVNVSPEGNLRLGKAIEINAGRLGETRYISLRICDESFTYSAEEGLANPMLKRGTVVILTPAWLNRRKRRK